MWHQYRLWPNDRWRGTDEWDIPETSVERWRANVPPYHQVLVDTPTLIIFAHLDLVLAHNLLNPGQVVYALVKQS